MVFFFLQLDALPHTSHSEGVMSAFMGHQSRLWETGICHDCDFAQLGGSSSQARHKAKVSVTTSLRPNAKKELTFVRPNARKELFTMRPSACVCMYVWACWCICPHNLVIQQRRLIEELPGLGKKGEKRYIKWTGQGMVVTATFRWWFLHATGTGIS